jgi:hypothetical protein
MADEPRIPEGDDAEAPDPEAPLEEDQEETSEIPDDAFYSPDDPIAQAEGEIPDDAIFSPDDPLTRTPDGEGVVTGMNLEDKHKMGRGKGLAWEIRATASLLEQLGRELRDQGMAALKVHPEMAPMDAMIRGFVAGYLVGQTDEEG